MGEVAPPSNNLPLFDDVQNMDYDKPACSTLSKQQQ